MLTSFSYPVIFQTMNPSKRIEMRSNVVLVCIFYSFVQFLVLLLSLSPHHDEPFYTEHTVSHFSLHFHLCSFFLVNIIGQFPSNTATNTPLIGIDYSCFIVVLPFNRMICSHTTTAIYSTNLINTNVFQAFFFCFSLLGPFYGRAIFFPIFRQNESSINHFSWNSIQFDC